MRQDDNGSIHVQLSAPFTQLHIHALLIWEEKEFKDVLDSAVKLELSS